ncbi:MAG TPA: PP2C family protein-serine/threonine phosphatase [Vicinamibacterales bacterium]|jgi:serine phosphatase RsbU (regulator of sigma subunit)|nr:PP2C family protein-serine/threonine phosphatase [Vicinamibacterales bacterium]
MSTETPLPTPYILPSHAAFRRAAAVQQSLRPPATCNSGFVDAAAAVRPSRLVSGDFYDFLQSEREFHVRLSDTRGMALFYGVMTRDHRLTYCCAGHCQPILVDGSQVRRLGAGRAPSDLVDDDVYKKQSLPIAKGDTLVVFSDGALPADRDDQEFGDARIVDIVTQPAATAAAIRDRLVNAVTDFTRGSRQRDDMAVLVVRYLG